MTDDKGIICVFNRKINTNNTEQNVKFNSPALETKYSHMVVFCGVKNGYSLFSVELNYNRCLMLVWRLSNVAPYYITV